MTWQCRTASLILAMAIRTAAAAGGSGCAGREPEPAGGPMRVLEAVHGISGTIEVLEHGGMLALAIDGVFQTVAPAPPAGLSKGLLLRGGDHVELIPWLCPAARTALIIGLGGGLQARALNLYGIAVTGVDIEPEVVRIAAERFGVIGETIVDDGRHFLETGERRFDAIVLDVFAGADLPEHLFTREALEAASRRLTPNGIMVVHLIGPPAHAAIRAVARTLREVFPCVLSTRAGTGGELQAIYLFGGVTPLELGPWVRAEVGRLGFTGREFFDIDTAGSPVLTDAAHGLSILARDIAEKHRRFCREIRRNPPW
jgi:SAM-dependent methyltransferase